ncbi:MAG: hypothetical protein Q9180_006490 [Flavoplaca navasiana]
MHQNAVQKDDTYHNSLQQHDTHQGAIVHDNTPNDDLHQTETPQDDTHHDDKHQEVQPYQETVKELGATEALQEIMEEAAGMSQACLRRIFGGSRRPCNEDDTTDPWIGTSTDVQLLSVSRYRVLDHIPIVLDQPELDHIVPVEETLPLNPLEGGLEPTSESAKKCIFCDDELPPVNIIQLPCGDRYCHECIVDQFDAAMKHESLFPPKCCGCEEQVPVATVQHLLPAYFEEDFKMRELELSTPNRIYCSNNDCAAFLDPWYIVRDTAACSKCFSYTCTKCQGPDHDGECHKDPDVIKTKATLAAGGYKQCPSCPYMIALGEGCNHMTYVSSHLS